MTAQAPRPKKPPGEIPHAKGEDGLQRAKQWLDSSTRVKHSWTAKDVPFGRFCQFNWPYAIGEETSFSFDLGGNFRGGDLDGQSFLAEIKNRKAEQNLPDDFRAAASSQAVSPAMLSTGRQRSRWTLGP